MQGEREANAVLSCSQHELRNWALVWMVGTSRSLRADPDGEGHLGMEQHHFSGGSSQQVWASSARTGLRL